MGEQQQQALARMCAEDDQFKTALMGATSVDDAVRIAREHGIAASADDFEPGEGDVSDAELEMSAGGTGSSVYVCLPTQVLCTIRWMCG